MITKKKIALFISHIFGEYQRNLYAGIMNKAAEYNYQVDIFATNDGESPEELGQGESNILKIPHFKDYCGVIVASGTYLDLHLKEQITETLKASCSCPILEINQEPGEFYTFSIDNKEPMKELVTHLIHSHKYERIAYLGNLQEKEFSMERYQSYQEVLQQEQLPTYDSFLAWCIPELNSVETAIHSLLENPHGVPDAIVCYNDSIALIVSKVLEEQGYRIPYDIAITGYDNLETAQFNIPSITSVEFPITQLGELAVDAILQLYSGETIPKHTIVPAHPVLRSSCGCYQTQRQSFNHYNLTLIDTISKREREMFMDINLSASLVNITDLDEGLEILEEFLRKMDGLSDFCLCLYPDWDALSDSIRSMTETEDPIPNQDLLLLKMGLHNKKRVPECTFKSEMVLPLPFYSDATAAYIYLPLYYKTKTFGYVALSYEGNSVKHSFSYMLWLRNINNMLQTIVTNQERTALVQQLETLYLRDELTNFWNAKGLRKQYELLKARTDTTVQRITMINLQLHELQQIKERYGQEEAQLCIGVIARGIKSNLDEGALCSKTNTDTFLLLLPNLSEDEAISLQNKIEKYVQNYVHIHKKEYTLPFTYDYAIVTIEDLEHLLPQ
ncbi:substrate-binding domain-containing protein [Anaerosporobacter faecicola]|uniref:substrate-binding domain-containing protein n=1 Tax=Anaerosporobacter faecicola TaxID=2718714 RepID=UPI00143AC69C|nr:substrate-binding domain-containing protein [Anaerosporobacter faecicola]